MRQEHDLARLAWTLSGWRLPGNDRLCEWVENRHWIFEATLPDEWFAGRVGVEEDMA